MIWVPPPPLEIPAHIAVGSPRQDADNPAGPHLGRDLTARRPLPELAEVLPRAVAPLAGLAPLIVDLGDTEQPAGGGDFGDGAASAERRGHLGLSWIVETSVILGREGGKKNGNYIFDSLTFPA